MKHFHSDKLDLTKLSSTEIHNIYCALDTCLTHEIYAVQAAELGNQAGAVYDFERSLVPPVLAMMRRGLLVDQKKCHEAVHGPGGLNERIKRLRRSFFYLAQVVLGNQRTRKRLRAGRNSSILQSN